MPSPATIISSFTHEKHGGHIINARQHLFLYILAPRVFPGLFSVGSGSRKKLYRVVAANR